MIPKIIHYCWLSNDPIPKDLKKYMKSWKEKLYDYEFILWDLNRFDLNRSLWVKQAFEAKKYAFAADYIRLYAVYNYGGIYMDMDVEVIKSFNDLLRNDYILGYEAAKGLEAGVFGAPKKAPWVKEVLEYYTSKEFALPNGLYNDTPLPIIMDEVLNADYITNKKIVPLPTDFLTAKSYKTGKITITPNTYTIHHFAGSWKSWDEKMKIIIVRIIGTKLTHILGNARRCIIGKK
jgi:hypothetical protein